MAVSDAVFEVLNNQINKELYSAYLYLTFADYYDDRGLKGYANWYMIQVQEELAHTKILRRYLLDNDRKPVLESIEQPNVAFENDMEPLRQGLAHEQYVTELINNCYAVADGVHDYRTMKLLDWFITEQGEEETNASDMVSDMENFGGDQKSLFELDREYATRVFNAPTLPM
jgi:ferritin